MRYKRLWVIYSIVNIVKFCKCEFFMLGMGFSLIGLYFRFFGIAKKSKIVYTDNVRTS